MSGLVGRPPVPTWLKGLRGTLRPAERVDEPQPEEAFYIPPPGELASRPIAKEFWEGHLPLLVKNRMITEVDMTAFAMACLAFEAWIEAEEELKTHGATTKTENGYVQQSGYFTIANARRKEVVEMLREFGLTPSSRTKIRIQLVGAPGQHSPGSGRDEHQEFFDF